MSRENEPEGGEICSYQKQGRFKYSWWYILSGRRQVGKLPSPPERKGTPQNLSMTNKLFRVQLVNVAALD